MEQTEIKAMTLPQLREAMLVGAKLAGELKAHIAALAGELQERLGASAKMTLAEQDKGHGTVNMQLQDGIVAKAVVTKTVKWDSDILESVARTMDWARVQNLFTLKFGMTETIYKGIQAVDPALCKQIDEARTVTNSEPKITLIDAP
jgi:hypothetical protein